MIIQHKKVKYKTHSFYIFLVLFPFAARCDFLNSRRLNLTFLKIFWFLQKTYRWNKYENQYTIILHKLNHEELMKNALKYDLRLSRIGTDMELKSCVFHFETSVREPWRYPKNYITVHQMLAVSLKKLVRTGNSEHITMFVSVPRIA